MSQNKKKFFGKHKDEQEQDLEQTQPLPPMPENNSDKTVQTEENTAPEEASEKADADEKNEKAEQLAKSFCKRFNRSKCIRVIIAAGLIILLVGGSVFAVIRSRHTARRTHFRRLQSLPMAILALISRAAVKRRRAIRKNLAWELRAKSLRCWFPREMRCMPVIR